jgi:hypothetical protein
MDWMIEEQGRVLAKISQIPLRLAWAMTVHKSQGMSLDAAFIDLRDAFVEGQGYVALSRVRTLQGLHLSGWNDMALKVHPRVLARDEEFRAQSEATREAFGKLSPVEFTQMQKNFVEACGGKFLAQTSEKKSVRMPGKAYSVEDIRRAYPNAYRDWSEDEDKNLASLHEQGLGIKAIANRLGRQHGSIRSRLIKVGLVGFPNNH